MYSLEQLYQQANKSNSLYIKKEYGESHIYLGVKIQKFASKIEILNCSKNGDYYNEISEDQYKDFFTNGWVKGCLILAVSNCVRKLKLIEQRMRDEVNTRKNDKYIKNLKNKREFVMKKYTNHSKSLIKLN